MKSLTSVLSLIVTFLVVSNVVYAPSHPETIAENRLYVTVIELAGSPETGMETAIINAKVSLAYGSIGGEQSMPQPVPQFVKYKY